MAKPNFTLPNKPAIKSGSILSYNYTDDFTFVPAPLTFNRDSAATRVNEKGLIEDVGYFGPELVQNGDFSEIGPELVTNGNFDTDSDWSKAGSVEIANSSANFTITSGSFAKISQNISLTNSKTYKLTLQVLGDNSGSNIYVRDTATGDDGGLQEVITLVEGTTDYTFYFTANANSNAIYIKRNTSSGNYQFSIDNVSVKEVGQNWTFGTGWSMGDGKAVKTSGTGSSLVQAVPTTTVGKKYKFTFDAIVTSGVINATIYGITIPTFTTSGSQEHTITATSTSGFDFYGNAFFEGSITNISIIEVLGDKPRIDYSDSLTEPSLLLEPQSTNLLPYSEDFYGYRVASSTVTPNSTTAPDGTNSGVLVTQGINQLVLRASNVISPSTTYTFSGYFKSSGSITKVSLDITDEGTQLFDLTNEWQRFSVTAQSKSTGPPYTFVDVATNGLQGDTFYAWGLQVEEKSYLTSYIPTSGSTATRLGETAINAGDVNVFNSEEGVLYAEIANLSSSGGDGYLSLSSDDGTQNNRATIRFTATTNNLACQYVIGAVNQTSMDNILTDRTEFNKIAFLYSLNNFVVFVNGVKLSTDTSGAVLPNGTFKKLTFNNGIVAPMYAKIKNVKVFNKALTDRELEILTIQ